MKEQKLIRTKPYSNSTLYDEKLIPQPIPPVSKSNLPSLPSATSLSPKRKLLHDQSKSKSFTTSDKSSDQPRLGFRFTSKEQFGSLTGHSHYLRLYELLRATHASYRVTLDQEASELYLGLLNTTLQVLSQLLEVASIAEAGRIAEEILHYLQSTVLLSAAATVQCVRQLLKCLFATNLAAKWSDVREIQCCGKREKRDDGEDEPGKEGDGERGFYEQCFQRPAKLMVERIKGIGSNCRGGNEPETGHRSV